MGFDWKEYLILAQFLQGKGNPYSEEAARRAAVSRAYYAAFCLARNYASINLQFVPEGKGVDHGALISWYNVCENYHPSLLGIGEKLRELLIWRNTLPEGPGHHGQRGIRPGWGGNDSKLPLR